MRKLIAWVFLYSLDGLLADDGTEYWRYAFGLPTDPAATEQKLELYRSTDIHLMGRTTYEAMFASMTATPEHPFAALLHTGRKVVLSRTLETADWPDTTIVSGDTATEIEALKQGGDGAIVAWGGVGLWRSLMESDLIDEFYIDVHPYVAGEGTRLFDGFPTAYRLELLDSTPFSNGIVTLHYRRPRQADDARQ